MRNRIITFIQFLRDYDVRVSISESLDSFQGIQVLGIEDKQVLKNALRTCLVKDKEDIETFDKLFDLYFSTGFHMDDEQREAYRKCEERQQENRLNQLEQEPQKMSEEEFEREMQEMMEPKQEKKKSSPESSMSEEQFLQELEELTGDQSEDSFGESENEDSGLEAEKKFQQELEELDNSFSLPSEQPQNAGGDQDKDDKDSENDQSSESGQSQQEQSSDSQSSSQGSEEGEQGNGDEQGDVGNCEDKEDSQGQESKNQEANERGQENSFSNEEDEKAESGSERCQEGESRNDESESGEGGENGQDQDSQNNENGDQECSQETGKSGSPSQQESGSQEGQECEADSGSAGEEVQDSQSSSSSEIGKELSAEEQIAQAVQTGDQDQLKKIAQDAVQALKELYLNNLQDAYSEAMNSLPIQQAKQEMKKSLETEMGREEAEKIVEDQFEKLEKEVSSEVDQEAVRRFGEEALRQIMRKQKNIEEMDFSRLDPEEDFELVEEIRKKIAKLARKLASRISRREKQAKRGKVDIRRTMRKSLQFGGVPIELAYKTKKFAKPELVLLCDVSGSVATFSEFMLQLVYTIQDKFSKVRSFVFVDCIDEITDLLKDNRVEPAVAVRRAKESSSVSWDGYSDFGNSFKEFAQRYLDDTVTDKTSAVILGDARNNGNNPELDSLRQIGSKSKKLIWLNPEPTEQWNSGDSIMDEYATVCNQVFECRNLSQLQELIEKII